jgi:hypothetical protein
MDKQSNTCDEVRKPSCHEGALCAFCGKGPESTGPLVESRLPGVYICYDCAQLCVYVVEEEAKRRGRPPPARESNFDDVRAALAGFEKLRGRAIDAEDQEGAETERAK